MSVRRFLRNSRIRPDEFFRRLRSEGFRRCFVDFSAGSIQAVRASRVEGCFEHVGAQLNAGGTHVGSWVRLTVVPCGNQWMGFFEDEILTEGLTNEVPAPVRSREEVEHWLNRLVAVAPQRCEQLAETRGPTLLDRVQPARRLAAIYLAGTPVSIDSLQNYWRILRSEGDDARNESARQMLRSSLLDLPAGNAAEEDRAYYAYQVAVQLIVGGKADGGFAISADPEKQIELAWCIQIMACELFQRRGRDIEV